MNPGWQRAARVIRGGLLLLGGLLGAPLAQAGEPPSSPILRIEAGGHIGAVTAVAVDAAGRLLATASYDKTIRLWSLPDGTPRGVLRPPIGALQEGEINAVALSPDGRTVFAAGSTGGQWDGSFAVYGFDVERAAMTFLLGGLPAPVNALAVSPDGARFAAGLAQGGVRVWEAATGRPVYEDRAYTGPVRALVFDRERRLFSTSADGKLRSYDAAGRKLGEASPPFGAGQGGLAPWGLALSPDGGLLAVTAETADRTGRARLDVVSARTLAAVFSPATDGLTGGGLLAVGWASDGRGGTQLLAGGYVFGSAGYVLRRWGDFGMGAATDVVAAQDTIRHLLPLPGGGAVYATEDPGWGRIAPDGQIARPPAPPMADLRPARDRRFAVSADGTVVEFASRAGVQRFALAERSLGPVSSSDGTLAAARTEGVGLSGWRDSNGPLLGGQKLPLGRNEFARSAAVLPGDGAVLLGTDTHLRLFGRDRRLLAAIETPAAVWAVTVAANAGAAGGGVAVAALLDGSLRWYSLDPAAPLQERAALFAHADGRRWVLFTPEGFFDHADRGGNELVGVHLNRARNQQPEWVSFSQAYRVLYAPAVVRALLLGQPGPAQARLAELGDIRARLARQPLVELRDACTRQEGQDCVPLRTARGAAVVLPAGADSMRLTAVVRERGLGVGPVDVFVNDRNAGRHEPPAANQPMTIDIPLDPGGNVVQLRVYDAGGTIFTEAPPLTLTRAEPPGTVARGRLFVLAVGVNTYANPTLALRFAVADAQSFVDAVRIAASPLYREVHTTALLDGAATRAGILAAFARLAREIRPRDTFLFYVATHGVVDETTDRFLLIPQDLTDTSSFQAMAAKAIDEPTLIAALSRIEARDALLFLDTCYAGKVAFENLAQVGHETGRYLLGAASSVQAALDSYDDRNGVFMYAVQEALSGRAGQDGDGNLGALALGEYVSRRVSQLARQKGHSQDAVFRAAQRELRSFPIGRVAR